MKTTYLLLLLILLYVSDAFPQAQKSEGTLSGYVQDKKGEERLPSVTIMVKGTVFIYAPLYGALYYAGISVNINY